MQHLNLPVSSPRRMISENWHSALAFSPGYPCSLAMPASAMPQPRYNLAFDSSNVEEQHSLRCRIFTLKGSFEWHQRPYTDPISWWMWSMSLRFKHKWFCNFQGKGTPNLMVQFTSKKQNDFWGDKDTTDIMSVKLPICCFAQNLCPEASVAFEVRFLLDSSSRRSTAALSPCPGQQEGQKDTPVRWWWKNSSTTWIATQLLNPRCKATNFMTFLPNKYWTISWCLTKLRCITFSPSLPSARLIQRSIQSIELHCQSSRQLSRWNVQKVND